MGSLRRTPPPCSLKMLNMSLSRIHNWRSAGMQWQYTTFRNTVLDKAYPDAMFT
jgi:hypothetical protein